MQMRIFAFGMLLLVLLLSACSGGVQEVPDAFSTGSYEKENDPYAIDPSELDSCPLWDWRDITLEEGPFSVQVIGATIFKGEKVCVGLYAETVFYFNDEGNKVHIIGADGKTIETHVVDGQVVS